jgi:hypothetical protein
VKLVAALAALAACHPPPSGPDLQVLGESVRRGPNDSLPDSSPWFDGTRVSLAGARGEVLGITVWHRDHGSPVTLELPSDAAEIDSYDVESFDVTHPSTAMYGGSHGKGAYADGLVPTSAPTTNPAYFEIHIRPDATATPGTGAHLDGVMHVAGKPYPVALRIIPVTLPPLPLDVWAYDRPQEHGDNEAACRRMFADYGVLLSPDIAVADWPARRASVAGVRDVPAWIPDEPVAAAAAVRAWIAAPKDPGQVPFAIPIDEPRTPEARAKVRVLADAVRAAGGGPTTFRYAVTDEPRPEYGNAIDLFISPRAAHLAGDTAPRWTYNGAPPSAGSMVLDADEPGTRTWGWIAWRWKIPVWYVWNATYWRDRHNKGKDTASPLDPARSPISFDDGEDQGNLDGVLALPGCRPTLRLAALRRGYEDRALLDLATRCDAPATAALAARIVPRALGDAPAHGAPSWSTDDRDWERARLELLALASCRVTTN